MTKNKQELALSIISRYIQSLKPLSPEDYIARLKIALDFIPELLLQMEL